jgi:hypothetical protein
MFTDSQLLELKNIANETHYLIEYGFSSYEMGVGTCYILNGRIIEAELLVFPFSIEELNQLMDAQLLMFEEDTLHTNMSHALLDDLILEHGAAGKLLSASMSTVRVKRVLKFLSKDYLDSDDLQLLETMSVFSALKNLPTVSLAVGLFKNDALVSIQIPSNGHYCPVTEPVLKQLLERQIAWFGLAQKPTYPLALNQEGLVEKPLRVYQVLSTKLYILLVPALPKNIRTTLETMCTIMLY